MKTQTGSTASYCGGSAIPEHCIRDRAYDIYMQRGAKGGHAEGDWLTAEAELKELKKKAADMVAAVESLTGGAETN